MRTTPPMLRRHGGLRALLVAAALGCLAPATVRAVDLDATVRPKGHGCAALSLTSQRYDEFWAAEEKVSDPMVGTVETTSWTLWLDYGLTDRLTLTVNVPYVDVDSDGTGGFGQTALQDLTVAAKFQFASVGSRVHSDFVGVAGVRTIASNYEIENSVVDIGDGTADWLARFIYQLRVNRFHFVQSLGWEWRGDPAPDGRPIYTVIGASWKRVTAEAFYGRLDARGGTDIGSGAPFPSNKEEVSRIGFKVWSPVSDHIGLSAMYFTTIDGRNTGDASGLSVGIDYRY